MKTTEFKSRFIFESPIDNSNGVKFIHASDIHLGAAQYRNEYRADDFINAFQEILDLAISYQVDFILLGGDVFTSLDMLPGKLTKIINILKDFKRFTKSSIPLIAIEGNHDIRKFSRGFRFNRRDQSWLKLLNSIGLIILLDADLEATPEDMFEFYNFEKKRGGKIQIKNVMVYGTHYLGEQPVSFLSNIRKAIIKDDDVFNILLQHFGIEGQMDHVPGVKLEEVQPLRHRVNYLALGHFHKQYILEDWIYNPGSSEAACAIDNSFQRGIFLVELSKNSGKFIKNVTKIRIINRKHIWQKICFNFEFRNKKDFEDFIMKKLYSSLKHLNFNIHPSNPQMPELYLILKGLKPSKPNRINQKELRKKICNALPVVDVRIYQKYEISLKTLDNYLIA